MNYSIVIVTYDKRFKKHLIPLIDEIKKQNESIEILLEINGNYNKQFDQIYRKEILEFCSKYENIYPQFYTKFTSLAKLWNRGIQNSSNNNVLVLNDDLSIKNGFIEFANNNVDDLKNNTIITINNTFSHFLINRNSLSSINWFDERFLGVGWEDMDVQVKLKKIPYINTDLVYNFSSENIEEKHQEVKHHIDANGKMIKYCQFNEDFFNFKFYHDKNHQENIQYPYYDFEISNHDLL
jgi:hypothetical protein